MTVSAQFGQVTRVATIIPVRELWPMAIEIGSALLPPPLKPDTNIDDLPEWVPRSVRLLGKATRFRNEICRRLLTDPRLKPNWQWMLRNKVEDADRRLDQFGDQGKLSKWGIDPSGIQINDQICGAIFIATLNMLTVNQFTSTRKTINAEVEKWTNAAQRCRDAQDITTFGYADANVLEALKVAAERLQSIGNLIKQDENPRILIERKLTKGNSLHKSHARSIALIMHHFFNDYAYVTVAKLVSVGLNLQPELKKKDIENWCDNLDSEKHRL